ncbi:hypothetical protein Ddc_19866 [Ditylenchus destructor]|nr:hypothetical protein Ddc_19866 [Ditylenchus destructor]
MAGATFDEAGHRLSHLILVLDSQVRRGQKPPDGADQSDLLHVVPATQHPPEFQKRDGGHVAGFSGVRDSRKRRATSVCAARRRPQSSGRGYWCRCPSYRVPSACADGAIHVLDRHLALGLADHPLHAQRMLRRVDQVLVRRQAQELDAIAWIQAELVTDVVGDVEHLAFAVDAHLDELIELGRHGASPLWKPVTLWMPPVLRTSSNQSLRGRDLTP